MMEAARCAPAQGCGPREAADQGCQEHRKSPAEHAEAPNRMCQWQQTRALCLVEARARISATKYLCHMGANVIPEFGGLRMKARDHP